MCLIFSEFNSRRYHHQVVYGWVPQHICWAEESTLKLLPKTVLFSITTKLRKVFKVVWWRYRVEVFEPMGRRKSSSLKTCPSKPMMISIPSIFCLNSSVTWLVTFSVFRIFKLIASSSATIFSLFLFLKFRILNGQLGRILCKTVYFFPKKVTAETASHFEIALKKRIYGNCSENKLGSLVVFDLDLVTRKNIPMAVWFLFWFFVTARLTLSEFEWIQ